MKVHFWGDENVLKLDGDDAWHCAYNKNYWNVHF